MKWRFNNKIIILQYRQYSCGKFLSNILSYNKKIIPNYDLTVDIMSLEDMLDIDNKHRCILKTLPPAKDKKNWLTYEMSFVRFFGLKTTEKYIDPLFIGSHGLRTHRVDQVIPKLGNVFIINQSTKRILETTDYHTFIGLHNDPYYDVYKALFPLSIDIQLIKDEMVNEISQKIKTKERIPACKFTVRKDSIKFDIGSMFDKNKFFENVSILLTELKLDDISLDDKVYEYYDRYMDVYRPYLNIV